MKQSTKILLAIFTAWPLAYMFIFFGFIFIAMTSKSASIVPVIFIFHFATMLIMFGLIIFYIVDIFRNNRVKQDQKALWAVVIFCGNMIAMPVYWYLFIWREAGEPVVMGQPGTAIKFCPKCGAENNQYTYCINCGSRLV